MTRWHAPRSGHIADVSEPTTGQGLSAGERDRLAQVATAEQVGILNLPTDDPRDPKRRRRVEATRPELLSQPAAVVATWEHNHDRLRDTAAAIARRASARVFLVGAGDSLAVAHAARYFLEATLQVWCEPVQSLEFAKYVAVLPRDSLVIALSSSGETTSTVEAMLVAQAAGALTVAVTNSPTSTLAELSLHTLTVQATRVGWPTQSSTAALGLLLQLGVLVDAHRDAAGHSEHAKALEALPSSMEQTLSRSDGVVADLAGREQAAGMHLFCGGGPNWASAVVGAAKVKECTPGHALAVQVEEYHHYNSQKAGEPLWLLAPAGPSVPRAVDTAREARRFGGQVYVATSQGESAFDGVADAIVRLPAAPELLSPLLYFLPGQLVGYHVAMAQFAAAGAVAS